MRSAVALPVVRRPCDAVARGADVRPDRLAAVRFRALACVLRDVGARGRRLGLALREHIHRPAALATGVRRDGVAEVGPCRLLGLLRDLQAVVGHIDDRRRAPRPGFDREHERPAAVRALRRGKLDLARFEVALQA